MIGFSNCSSRPQSISLQQETWGNLAKYFIHVTERVGGRRVGNLLSSVGDCGLAWSTVNFSFIASDCAEWPAHAVCSSVNLWPGPSG